MAILRLGVLAQSPVKSGGTPADAIHETLELARATERLGYHRYWLAEHHSIIVTLTHDPKARRRSCELLAEAVGLARREGGEP